MSYCKTCLPSSGYIQAWYPNIPAEMITFYENRQIKYLKIPAHNPLCERVYASNAPDITSPQFKVEYFVDKTDTTEIMLSCNAAIDVDKVFWYINDKLLKQALPTQKIFFKPFEGDIKISCTDDKGRNTNTYITVKMINF